jgi:hypothetical protein
MLEIKDIMLKFDKVKTNDNTNSTKVFLNILLSNYDIKKEILEIILKEIYKNLKCKNNIKERCHGKRVVYKYSE